MELEMLAYEIPLKKTVEYKVISNKTDYLNFLEADRIALGRNKMTLKCRIKDMIYPDYIWRFQRLLRKMEYYKNTKRKNPLLKVNYYLLKIKFLKLSLKLGFTIPENVFGPGLAIVHYGTIVVNGNSKIGANCRIHACTNIGESGGVFGAPHIGNNVYIGPGAKIYGKISIASNTAIAANACVGKTFTAENMLLGGIPARALKEINIKRIIKHLESMSIV
ncbi:serine O-acetyltransferase [Pedobacter immunditicola]|uniref:serine O-acetyltransferase n=1 Tax=Pedobacter immunditicola TaxID=3133440 RepID=UPI0030AD4146